MPFFSEKIERVKNSLSSWSAGRLTLLGKMTIIKALAVSQIVHVLTSLPTHQGALQEINILLIWLSLGKQRDKVRRTQMIRNDDNKGGLKMIDIQSFNKSLKNKVGKWKLLVDFHLQKCRGKVIFLKCYYDQIVDIHFVKYDCNIPCQILIHYDHQKSFFFFTFIPEKLRSPLLYLVLIIA